MKVIWFSEIKWTYLRTRKQQLITHFPEDWEVLFIESYVFGKKNRFWPRREGRVTYATVPFLKATPYPAINKLQSQIGIRWAVTLAAWLWIKALFVITGFATSNRVVCLSNIYYSDLVGRLARKLTLYDCNDYPAGFSNALPIAQIFFEKTLRMADLVVTVSKNIHEKINLLRSQEVFVIGNGVADEHFMNLGDHKTPEDLATILRPIVLYVGAISDWFDTGLLLKLCTQLPLSSFVLIGPILSQSVREKMKEFPRNLHWLKEKEYHQLPGYIMAADACIIPFLKNQLTEGLNPNKLYEYLACGKPVVTMDYSSEIGLLEPLIFVAHSHEEFIMQTQRALQSLPDTGALQRIAHENSWKKKSEAFTQLIVEHLP